jgi:outer membrane protein insertion porin family
MVGLLPSTAAFAAFLAAAAPLFAQQEPWEGKPVREIRDQGWSRYRFKTYRDQLQLKKGQPYTKEKRASDIRLLFKTTHFADVDIQDVEVKLGWFCKTHPNQRGPVGQRPNCPICSNLMDEDVTWDFVVVVQEYEIIEDVLFTGVESLQLNTLKHGLRLEQNQTLNPWLIKADLDYLKEQYITKGYYFFRAVHSENGKEVEGPEIVKTATGVIVHWHLFEGPLVTVDEVRFTGISPTDDAEVRRYLQTRSRGSIFGLIPMSGDPFVQRFLEEDLKRIRLFFFFEGWLDIGGGERIFVEELKFSRDKTKVTVVIHCDLGRAYKVRKVVYKGNSLFTEEQLRAIVKETTEGGPYSDNRVGRDQRRILDQYGERAYILAEIVPSYTVAADAAEVTVTFTIQENNEISVGRIIINGNTKTRYDVILRELKDFTPGDKFNRRLLDRGIARLRDRGYFETLGGVQVHTEPGAAAGERDVVIDVREGTTGNIRFAGGFSSSFGILGIIEFTQKNFDITDLPRDLEDLVSGNAFAGGGQLLRLRAAPAAKRQSYLAEFREPYVFGYEVGAALRGLNAVTTRSTYIEDRLSGSVSLEKRFDPFRVELRYEAARIEIKDIEIDAPVDTFAADGTNYIYTLTPSITLDLRDSALFPSEGLRLQLSYEFAGVWLGGDWDYGKFILDADYHITLLTDDDKRKHVLTFEFKFGWGEAFRDTESLPIFERFYAGGRDSIRGFEFRGVGPHENGEPTGGQALVVGTVEYSWPLFGEFLRGAVFYDIGNIARELDELGDDKFRNTVGFGIRFIIPQLGNIPVALDFGFPLSKEDDDERQTVTFDIGKLF